MLKEAMKTKGRYFGGALALLGSLAVSGCHTDMWIQPYIEPYKESGLFRNQQGMRPVVEGTVAQGGLRLNDNYYRGHDASGKELKSIPVEAVKAFVSPKEMLVRGKDRYEAFCYPCHGSNGNGNGFISVRGRGYWQKMPASYHIDRLRKANDGYLYDVITNGHGVMYGYASRIQDVNDRWAIVAYIRALQYSRSRPIESVSQSALSGIGAAGTGKELEGGAATKPATAGETNHGGEH